ncbi:MAG: MotA/TolQ/ExbB proton channel family protein [Planctomycetota bacterium]
MTTVSNPSPNFGPTSNPVDQNAFSDPNDRPLAAWRRDPERWLGARVSRGTSVNTSLAGLVAAILTTIFFVSLAFTPPTTVGDMLLNRGPTQYAAVFLGFWCVVILLAKRRKLAIQRQALKHAVIPDNHEFKLTPETATVISRRVHELADDPDQFLVLNRILVAMRSLENLGRMEEVDKVLRSIADRDESAQSTSFGMLSGFLWAIPVLGFIGTVLGLAAAIGNFGAVLEAEKDIDQIVQRLKEVTGGLSTAFETTLVALLIALVLQLWISSQRKSEEEFLDDCQEYCLKQILSRMRSGKDLEPPVPPAAIGGDSRGNSVRDAAVDPRRAAAVDPRRTAAATGSASVQ